MSVQDEQSVREDIHKVKKLSTASGNIRLVAEDNEDGHADRFWALALAYHAAYAQAPAMRTLERMPLEWQV